MQESSMQDKSARSTSNDDLLDDRAAMLGLALGVLRGGGEPVEAIKRRCRRCEFAEACELDLRRDPNDPAWETYCPNTAALIALAESSGGS
jgi:hypothetical protein